MDLKDLHIQTLSVLKFIVSKCLCSYVETRVMVFFVSLQSESNLWQNISKFCFGHDLRQYLLNYVIIKAFTMVNLYKLLYLYRDTSSKVWLLEIILFVG